ncbi:hypothetical protein ANCCAN_16820 [Ancylostoma caninum]|uniref:Uncharacterized protein n=1 Tax=Ancylostoma caninum TaxID=29170 RepID=A0A368FYL6_ANCCA|nr:hypothetical protein ANCCAN_16820 [Ancylostoma caninum]
MLIVPFFSRSRDFCWKIDEMRDLLGKSRNVNLLFSDAQSEDAEELQAKLQALNRLIDSDQVVPNSHQRVPFTHSGISEDSDYTSDVSFPIHHQPNSSAHQWDSHLHPHRYRHHPKDTVSFVFLAEPLFLIFFAVVLCFC